MRKKRSKTIPGSYEDSNRFIRCHHCGSIVDMTRVVTGQGHGNRYTDFPIEGSANSSGDPMLIVSSIEPLESVGVILANEPDGTELSDYYTPRKSVAYSGCWLCGCKNLP